MPAPDELPQRLDSVLRVIYLVFNEGYSASSGPSLTRLDLSGEAIRLGRLLVELLPEPEAMGLLALMLLQESRRAARTSPAGELILLSDQDRSLWNRDQIAEGSALVDRALASRRFGPYTLQAAIAAVHADAASADATDWGEIVGLYDVLLRDRSVACGRAEPRGGGGDARRPRGGSGAHRRHPRSRRSRVTTTWRMRRARTCAGGWARPRTHATSYQRALALARQEPERRFLERRLAELPD